ncbi:MAG: hypothetical protein KTR35_02030 [Gammaproteobacteria bacterium]|nr:hypothetical protein [Gammaproteobacteria bacterium]
MSLSANRYKAIQLPRYLVSLAVVCPIRFNYKGPLLSILTTELEWTRFRLIRWLGLLICLFTGVIQAESLLLPSVISVTAGERIEQSVVTEGQLESYQYRLLNAPADASLQNASGTLIFVWDTPDDLPDRTHMIITATPLGERKASRSERFSVVRMDTKSTSRVESNQIPTFPALSTQRLRVGRTFKLWMRVIDPDTGPAEIVAGKLPAGALFDVQSNGGYEFQWRPSADQAGTHPVSFVALDSTDESLQVERTLYFEVSANMPDTLPDAEPVLPVAEILASTNARTTMGGRLDIEPISNQIIGVGQLVSFPVVPVVTESADPVLQVDRLPKGATFDINPLGVRVFRWQTSDSDEGEHIFRFSLFDKNFPAVRNHKEVAVVVGNPTTNSTAPKPLPGAEPPTLDVPAKITVRAGQQIQFRVAVSLNETASTGEQPPVTMYRSPQGANLHSNPDGSRLFRWQPDVSQIGEHIVSFSVRSPIRTDLETHRDVVVQVIE